MALDSNTDQGDQFAIDQGGGAATDPNANPDGGGSPGTGTGGTTPPIVQLPNNENGGILASSWILFVPVQDIVSKRSYVGMFDIFSNDDPFDGASYSYRAEELIPNSVATVREVWVSYKDLGPAAIIISVSGVNDDQEIVGTAVNLKLGTVAATGTILNVRADLQLTCFRPQLTWTRVAGGGPVCITAMEMRGEIDED